MPSLSLYLQYLHFIKKRKSARVLYESRSDSNDVTVNVPFTDDIQREKKRKNKMLYKDDEDKRHRLSGSRE